MIAPRIAAVLAGVSIAFAAGWAVNGWRLGEKIERIHADQAQSELSAALAAGIKEAEWTKNLEDARNAATKREQELRLAAAGARDAADGLRGDLAAIRRNLPGLAADAVSQYADTLADVFGACAARYSELAATVDGLANDRQTLMDAWPR